MFKVDPSTPVDVFGTGTSEWHLAFRGTSFIQQSVYEAYLRGTDNVDLACKQTVDTNLPCSSHYRSPILDDWRDIEQVAFVIYKYGQIQKYAIFAGTDTDNTNWFRPEKLISSSWYDLKGKPQFFNIAGDPDPRVKRRFFINHNYQGCNVDAGWFVAVDQPSPPCQWENQEGYPVFMYSTSSTYENWTTGKFAQADVIAVFLKYKEKEDLPFVDVFGNGRREWKLAFRGTAHINESVYHAYLHGSPYVDYACKQTDSNVPCDFHYRSLIMNDWKDIAEVAFVLYKSGKLQKYAVFNGVGTNNINWFSATKLKSSSWSDLGGHKQYFSIFGDGTTQRRFFINHNYGGCDKDMGWIMVKDQGNNPCVWERIKSHPMFLYSTSSTVENWLTGSVAEADVIAVFVRFGSASPVVG